MTHSISSAVSQNDFVYLQKNGYDIDYKLLIDHFISGRESSFKNIRLLAKGFKKLYHNNADSKLKKNFKLFFDRAKLEILDEFLNIVASIGLKEKNLGLHESALSYLSYDRLQEIFTHKEKVFGETYASIEELASNVSKYFSEPPVSKAKTSLLIEIKRGLSLILNFIPNIINTFLIAFSLYDIGKEPQTAWEASAMLDVYYKFIMIPSAIIVVLSVILPFVGFKLYAIAAGVILICSLALFVYVKWFRPCPNRLPYCVNLTEDVKLGRISTVVGRNDEIDKLVALFSSLDSNNSQHAILVGPSGIGKTEVVKGFAQRIAQPNSTIPQKLRNKKIFVINTASLVQGGKWGYADQLTYLLNKVKGYENEVIFFFDEIHAAFKNSKNSALSDYLKPILDRGKIHCIAATTTEEYKKYIEKDIAFKRRFQRINVGEMKNNTVKEVLQTLVKESSDNVYVEEEAIDAIIKKTNKLKKKEDASEQQPAYAVQILTHAMKKVAASTDINAEPPKLVELKAELNSLKSNMSSHSDLFPTSPKGRILFAKIQKIEKEIKMIEGALSTKKAKIEKFKKTFSELKEKNDELKKEAFKGLKNRQNNKSLKHFYWQYAYTIPQLQKVLNDLKIEINDEHIKIAVDEKLIEEVLMEIEENNVEN